MDHRSRLLLKALVERYILDGQPVGSRTLSRHSGLDLSPATIRNVMADLEDMGLIASPHTSAGRIPTPRGYRLFVDSLLTVKPIEVEKTEEMQDRLQSADPQRVLASAASLLSSLSSFAGVVMTALGYAAFADALYPTKQEMLLLTRRVAALERDTNSYSGPVLKADAPRKSNALTAKFVDSGTVFVDAAQVDTYVDAMRGITKDILANFEKDYMTCP